MAELLEPIIDYRSAKVPAGRVMLEGILSMPKEAVAVVLVGHSSGRSRTSRRNRLVANMLNEARLATLRIDLWTPEEDEMDFRTAGLRFDIGLLAERLGAVTEWLTEYDDTRPLPIGYFSAGTGVAAALAAASQRPAHVGAVVSQGGRPDLAGAALARLRAPTLLIVGGNDLQAIELNKEALRLLRCEKELVSVAGATHSFEEPGTLDEVAGWRASGSCVT